MNTRRRLSLLLLLAAGLLCGSAGYVQAKAWLAQLLLEQAWQRSAAGAVAAKPWPWADTRPVARLRVARLGVDQIVLAGDSGRSLAFGPAWNEASAAPGAAGTSVISGHRDTHFEFLRHLSNGDVIEIESRGRLRRYRISAQQVVDARTTRIAAGEGTATSKLLLVTCYPFDGWIAGGPLRYVIEAVPV
ncbi:class GN sortase [Tahibacter harae]|uniref:Class GN sortase n=1 Tax=Tahibacter harae TaxID=2963937 RepID=A0ABT1QQT7_9GAMM|nr:class GN sortase [Tahibacter harae]MCQ4164627.1 class GN sortase [Tahibacter harae]